MCVPWIAWLLEECMCLSPCADSCLERRDPPPQEYARLTGLCACACHGRLAAALTDRQEVDRV